MLVIEGPPGIGKRRLPTEVMACTDKCGVRTLFGEAFEYQQTVLSVALGVFALHDFTSGAAAQPCRGEFV